MIERAARVGRWVARIFGTLMVLLFLVLFFGEGPPRFSQFTTREWLIFFAWVVLELGLILAWVWEGLGGLLTLAGFLFLGLLDRRVLGMGPVLLCAATGCLHLLCWWKLRARREPPPSSVRQRVFLAILWTGVGIIVLLLANEALLTPPLMTPAFKLPPVMVGAWQAKVKEINVALSIRSDGALSGTIGDATVANGRIIGNRSWLGRTLNWRSDYLILGNLSGSVMASPPRKWRRFSAPINLGGNDLVGTLFLFGRTGQDDAIDRLDFRKPLVLRQLRLEKQEPAKSPFD